MGRGFNGKGVVVMLIDPIKSIIKKVFPPN